MSGDNDNNTNRLRDMEVREVAFVDRAANRRRFLVVKRSETMPAGSEVNVAPDGSLTSAAPEVEQAKEQAPEVGDASTEPAPEASAPAAPQDEGKAECSLTSDAQKIVGEVLKACMDKALALQKMVEDADVVEGESEMSTEPLMKGIMEVSDALSDVAMAALQTPPPPPAPEASDESMSAPPMSKRYEVIRAQRVVRESEADTLVLKAGARMKKERLARFQQAHAILGDLLVELTNSVKQAEQADADKKKKAEAQKLAEANENLRKQLQQANAKLEKARGVKPESNATPVEKGERDTPFSWPLDMNRDLGRSAVEKKDFFGG